MRSVVRSWLKRAADAIGAEASNGASADAPDQALATTALLVEAAQADEQYLDAERDAIDAAVGRLFELDAAEAKALRERAEAAQSRAVGVHRFTRAVVESLEPEARIAVIEALWSVVLADGDRHAQESALMRRLAALLYVSDRDSGLARQRALDAAPE